VTDATRETLNTRSLRPAGQPKVEIVKFEEGADLEYTLAFELFPEIKPLDFATLKLERLVAEIDEAEIDKHLARLAEGMKGSQPVADDRPAKAGDVVVIDFVGSVDGKEFAGGKAEGYHLELGSGSFIPGFEDQLIGAKGGDKREVKVTFPAEYGNAELAGKAAVFTVEVKEVRESVPTAIDDALAKKLGIENLEALKKRLREEHEKEYGQLSRLRLKRALLDRLAEIGGFEVPEGLVEGEFQEIWKHAEAERKAAAEHGQPHPDSGKGEDELKGEYRAIAERRVKLGLLLSEIGRLNNIQVTAEDVNRAVVAEARRFPGQEQVVVNYYRSNAQATEGLKPAIFEDKVVDFILEMAAVNDRKVPAAELLKDPDETGDAAPETKKKGGAKKGAKKKAEGE
jgi:trigger factor